MKYTTTILIPLIIVPIFTFYWGTRYNKSPKVIAQLSDSIPIKEYREGEENFIQQLKIQNIGNAAVHQIVIKINSRIKNFQIIKPSALAIHKTVFADQRLTVSYDGLLPENMFQLILKTAEGKLDATNISISSDNEMIRPTESKTKTDDSFLWVAIMALFMISSSVSSFYSLVFNFKVSDIVLRPMEGLFLNKPMYLRDSTWKKIIDKGIESFASKHAFEQSGRVSDWPSYRILDMDKPSGLMEDQWHRLKGYALRSLENSIRYKVYYELHDLLTYTEVPKPKFLTAAEWHKILEESIERHLKYFRDTCYNKKKAQKFLSMERPLNIPEHLWQDFTEALKRLKD